MGMDMNEKWIWYFLEPDGNIAVADQFTDLWHWMTPGIGITSTDTSGIKNGINYRLDARSNRTLLGKFKSFDNPVEVLYG